MAEESTCLREVEVEISADVVAKETKKVVREITRAARIPGFRPGKAPASLVQQRYWDDIKSEVLQTLLPESLETKLKEQNLRPLSRPEILNLKFEAEQPVTYRAAFEILPEFELGEYKGLTAPKGKIDLTKGHVEEELERMREQHTTFEPVENRGARDGDIVLASLQGEFITPDGDGREPLTLENAEVQIGSDQTLKGFSKGLTGAKVGEDRTFTVDYPEDYHEKSLASASVKFTATVSAIRKKILPKLDDEFAKAAGDFNDLKALRKAVDERLKEGQAAREKQLTEQNVLDALLDLHSFPVPRVLIEDQVSSRLERRVRAMMAQGIDPRTVDIDWQQLRQEQQASAAREVQIALLLERIAESEKIDASDEDITVEIERLSAQTGQKADELRNRLTKDGGLDRMKNAVRHEKVVDFLVSHAKLTTKDGD